MTPRRAAWLALCLGLAATATAAQPQTVWRCGRDGSTYTDQPCVDGRSIEPAPAGRSAAEVHAAQQVAAREHRLADALTQERQKREAQSAHLGASGIGMPPRPVFKPPASMPPPKKRRRPPRPAAADTSPGAVAGSLPSRD